MKRCLTSFQTIDAFGTVHQEVLLPSFIGYETGKLVIMGQGFDS